MEAQNKIMIVDDNPDILLSLRAIFEAEKYEVITVDNGQKCLTELKRGFRGTIILDIMMPVMDGIETIKNMVIEGFIEENTIIVLTVKKIQGEEFDDIYNYIHDYIQKPFSLSYLKNVIDHILSLQDALFGYEIEDKFVDSQID